MCMGFSIGAGQRGRGASAEMIDGVKPQQRAARHIWQHCLIMVRKLLIGGWAGQAAGGLNGWIIFGLHYRALLPRFMGAVIFYQLFSCLDWDHAKSFALLAVAGYASLLSLRFTVRIAEFGDFGRIVTAMWMPIGVMALAAYFLFFNDQGQELGLGLLDPDLVRLGALFLVLIYWGLSAWLSARIRLSETFPKPEKHQRLLFWGPRLVGALAHLLAAGSLSCAALKDTQSSDLGPNVLLAFAAPSAIVLAILFVWYLDHAKWSDRSSDNQRARAHRRMPVVAFLVVALFIVLGLAWWPERKGLFLGTCAVSLSAIAFLGLISWIRWKAPLGPETSEEERRLDALAESRTSWRWAWGLAAVMGAGTVLIWITPMEVGRLFGSLIIAFFAFGSFLVGANLLDLTADFLAQDCKKRRFTAVHRRAVWCVFAGLLVVPAILMSATRHYHPVRLCEAGASLSPCTSAPAPAGAQWNAIASIDKRPTVTEAAEAWYRHAKPIYEARYPGKPVPLFIIATAGGGIRAAYWTATVLEALEGTEAIEGQNASARNTPVADGLMRHLLFAISGVSGGSVGASAYIAAVHDRLVNGRPVRPTSYLKGDLLAPGLASLAFIDIPSNFLPDFGQIDRGEALERGLEHASTGLMSHSFISFFPKIGSSQESLSWRPALLLNATHQETGRRIITSNLKIRSDIFVGSYDALDMLGSDVRLSTAAHNSARFTYVSPAGNLIRGREENSSPQGFVIDGGYFENYGAQTAVELARKAIEAIKAIGGDIRPVILQISSDPTMVENKTLVRQRCTDDGDKSPDLYRRKRAPWDLSLFNELKAPVIGIMSVRESHGFAAVSGLAKLCCEDSEQQARNSIIHIGGATDSAKSALPRRVFVHLAMCAPESDEHINPPLGWVLSEATRNRFNDLLNKCRNELELTTLEQALGVTINKPKSIVKDSYAKLSPP